MKEDLILPWKGRRTLLPRKEPFKGDFPNTLFQKSGIRRAGEVFGITQGITQVEVFGAKKVG